MTTHMRIQTAARAKGVKIDAIKAPPSKIPGVARALSQQAQAAADLSAAVLDAGAASASLWADILAIASSTPRTPTIEPFEFPLELAQKLHLEGLQTLQAAPAISKGKPYIAALNPFDAKLIEIFAPLLGSQASIATASEAELSTLIAQWRAAANTSSDAKALREQAQEGPVVRYVTRLINEAAALNASDIHLEPTPQGLEARLRVDGVLRAASAPPQALALAVISRIKIISGLDIAERRRPQDGRAELKLGSGAYLDLRVATAAGLHGETISIRLLRTNAAPLSLPELGATPALTQKLSPILARGSGLILAAGPTGAGKTTTLHALLAQLSRPDRKVMSIEDPIERRLPGVTQLPVQAHLGVGFAPAFRAVLRHDPDVVMVGEMRDDETTQTAIQAALSGHLILSSLHAKDAAAACARLEDLGVSRAMLASTLSAVLAQRLLRRLCPHCKTAAPSKGFVAPGCEACHGAGAVGRIAVYELLVFTPEIASLWSEGASVASLRNAAREAGACSLGESAQTLARAGTVSYEEAARAAGELA